MSHRRRAGALSSNGLLSMASALQSFENAVRVALIEAGADEARANEVTAAVEADQQRAQVRGAAAPAADDNFMAGEAL